MTESVCGCAAGEVRDMPSRVTPARYNGQRPIKPHSWWCSIDWQPRSRRTRWPIDIMSTPEVHGGPRWRHVGVV